MSQVPFLQHAGPETPALIGDALAGAGVDGAALVARAPAALRTLHAVARPAFAAFASHVR